MNSVVTIYARNIKLFKTDFGKINENEIFQDFF